MNVVRVLVVEDEPLYRQGLFSQLSECPGIEVAGAASSGQEAIELAERLDPDVVLMDIELGGDPNGIQAGKAINSTLPHTGIVLLSSHSNKQYLTMAEESGRWSYLLKKNVHHTDTLVRAIQGAAWGLVVVDPELTEDLKPRIETPLARLSEGQLKVLVLVAQGYSDEDIAAQLKIDDERTVPEHLTDIYQVLDIEQDGQVESRVKAVLAYLDQTRSA